VQSKFQIARSENKTALSDASTPLLGTAVRDQWLLDWEKLTVNHGSFGATPRVVLDAQLEWRSRLEAQPTLFMRKVLPDALRSSAEHLGAFVRGRGRDLVFVENATTGCNAVLRSLSLQRDDEILILSHAYGAVRNTVQYVAQRSGAQVVEAEISFPQPEETSILANVSAALSKRTRIAVIDHITSHSALVLPVSEIIETCHAAGVPVLVDGAHGPGQINVDLTALDADWYVGNCHKWLMAPKGCAFLWSHSDRQSDLHPTTVSHGYGNGYLAEFDWTGTRDPSAFLAVETAIAFHHQLGGAALQARNAELIQRGATIVARYFGTDTGASREWCASMAMVRLPSLLGAATFDQALRVRQHLLDADCDAPLFAISGQLWVRISAQAYNVEADYERLSALLEAALAKEQKLT
jgi:isopenicillin-N epimerase